MKKLKGGDIKSEKLANKALIAYLHKKHDYKHENEIRRCVNHAIFMQDKHGKKALYGAFFCHNNLCAICQKRKSMRDSIKVKKVIEHTEKTTDIKHSYLFFTLTLKNVKSDKVKETQKHINKSITKMFKYKALQGVLGRIKTVEITYNSNRQDYHVHAHILVMVRPSMVKGRKRLTEKRLSELWGKASKSDYIPVVHKRLVKDGTLSTIANYITKPMNYLQFVTNSNIKDKSKVIDTIYNALRYQHRITFSGLFRVSNSALIALKHNYTESELKAVRMAKIKPMTYLFYKWSYNYNRHVLYDQISATDFESTISI